MVFFLAACCLFAIVKYLYSVFFISIRLCFSLFWLEINGRECLRFNFIYVFLMCLQQLFFTIRTQKKHDNEKNDKKKEFNRIQKQQFTHSHYHKGQKNPFWNWNERKQKEIQIRCRKEANQTDKTIGNLIATKYILFTSKKSTDDDDNDNRRWNGKEKEPYSIQFKFLFCVWLVCLFFLLPSLNLHLH